MAPNKKRHQSEAASDASLSDELQEENEESLNHVSTVARNVIEKRPKLGNNSADNPCSGYIESLELIDFMCHRHLLISLNPNINFIVGNNGSGKSAILTALTVCLGGRASSTQRATNIDSLIREGAQSGKIKVKLYNKGDNPYQPNIYGDHIIIERSFKRDGANSYSIYSGNNKLVAGRKEQVNFICDHFGIQVDNPLAILTQETAKKFLANAKPKELYEFFMKATQLEHLSIDYVFAMDKIKESRQKLEQSKFALRPLRETINRLERQLADLERFKLAHQNIQLLRKELIWALVQAKEREVELIKDGLQEKRSRYLEILERINDLTRKHEEINSQIKEMENGIMNEHKSMDPLLVKRSELSNALKLNERNLSTVSDEAKQIKDEFVSLKSQLEELEAKIEEESHKQVDGRREKLFSQLKNLDEEMISLNRQIANEREMEEELAEKLVEATNTLNSVSRQRDELMKKIELNMRSIQREESCKGDRLKSFGERMPEVIAEIKRTKFSKQPIGPAGMYIKLKDIRWVNAMEAILNNFIEAFVVDNHHDRVILQNILKKFNMTNSIVVIKFDGEIDISDGEPDPQHYLTALKVLTIENPVVRKMLIFMCHIESSVLINNREDALSVARNRPRNVANIYTTTAKVTPSAKSVQYSQLHTNPNRPKIISTVDTEDRIKDLRKQSQDLQKQKSIIDRDYSSATGSLREIQGKQDRHRNDLATLESKLRRVKNEARNIQDELREQEPISHKFYEQEKRDVLDKMEIFKAQFQANSDQLENFKEIKRKTLEELNIIDEEISNIKDRNNETIELVSESVKNRKLIEREMEVVERSKSAEQVGISSQETALKKLETELDEMINNANAFCSRIRVTRSVEEIDRELTAQEECLENNETSRIDPIQVKTELDNKTTQLRESERSIILNEDLIVKLSDALKKRQIAWEDFRRSVSQMSTTDFLFMLNARGFQGSLEYRHHEGELVIKVIPQGQQTAQTTASFARAPKRGRGSDLPNNSIDDYENRDVRQLSGGEKSYSTACFLFSLWQAMGSPLRCLDEFDVYMDSVNRDYILELLVSHARMSKVQFILITPNAISDNLRQAKDVRIYRLRDPDRGQRTII